VAASDPHLNPSDAARRLGVSVKALRLYEQRGLLAPKRTAAGWRVYGPDEMKCVAGIVALRELGLSLRQVALVLQGDAEVMEQALAGHQTVLEGRLQHLASAVERVRCLRADLTAGRTLSPEDLAGLVVPGSPIRVAFDLPWPWGEERFELNHVRALNYIVGPLGSGKTRLAQRLAETLPDADFLGLDRLADGIVQARQHLDVDPALQARVDSALNWLVEDGAIASEALLILLVALESQSSVLVIDMLEQGLDQATQEALVPWLRGRACEAPPLFFLTRSSAILDLDAVGPHETIIFCPANHSPPTLVAPYRGAPGYEALASCLASPEVRARTAGVVAWRPEVA
jgi:DNA-binding transcriptional MerR regulator